MLYGKDIVDQKNIKTQFLKVDQHQEIKLEWIVLITGEKEFNTGRIKMQALVILPHPMISLLIFCHEYGILQAWRRQEHKN